MCQSHSVWLDRCPQALRQDGAVPYPRGSGTTGAVRESAQNSCHPSGCQADLTGLVGVPSFSTAPKVVSSQASTFQRKRNTLVGPSPQVRVYSAPSDLKCSLTVSLTEVLISHWT